MQNVCGEADGTRLHPGVFCPWSRTQSAAHGNGGQDPLLRLWNDMGEKIVGYGESWYCLHPRLIFGALTSGSGWLQRRLRKNTRSQSCRQSLDIRPETGCKLWIILDLVSGEEVMDKEKVVPYLCQVLASPVTPSSGSPVGFEIHLPGDELTCFISLPSHPFTHSFCLSFPHPPPVPVSSLNTTLLSRTPAVRLMTHNPAFPHTSPVQDILVAIWRLLCYSPWCYCAWNYLISFVGAISNLHRKSVKASCCTHFEVKEIEA